MLKFDGTVNSPAKKAFVDKLRTKYAAFNDLKTAWNQASVNAMVSWDDFLTKSVVLTGLDSFQFVASEFKSGMTPEALLAEIRKTPLPFSNIANTPPIDLLNQAVKNKDLYKYLPQRPADDWGYIAALEKGLALTDSQRDKLNRALIEVNYPQLTPVSTANSQQPLVQDLSFLLSYYAETYFSTAKNAIKRSDPNHLYLGSRFASFHRAPREAIDACVKYCDVYTVNYYNENMQELDWNYLLTKDIPIMITEFTFGAPSNGGAWGGIIWFNSQAERVKAYTGFLNQWVDKPQSVGFFYHLYVDMPLTGMNFESENYYSSFVTTTDRPYPEMVAAAKIFNDSIYRTRGSAAKPVPASPGGATGDVSLNGRLSLYDSVLVSRYLGGYSLSQQQLDQADVVEQDKDIVNKDDALAIAQHVMGGTSINQCTGGSLSDHLKSEINSRIVSSTAANIESSSDKVLWTRRGNDSGGWVRNTNAWTNKGAVQLDLTGASPWNSHNPLLNNIPYNPNGVRLAGTLITPRHLLLAAHASLPVGTKVVFVDKQNNIITPIPTITAYRRILTTDIVVATLSADMPSSIAYYPILDKAELSKYINTYQNIPLMILDQEDKALIKDTSSNFVSATGISFSPSTDPKRALFNESLISGDSGNPGFVIINGKLVILLTILDPSYGPNLVYYKNLIQEAINQMSPTPAYTLPQVDLSCFDSNGTSS